MQRMENPVPEVPAPVVPLLDPPPIEPDLFGASPVNTQGFPVGAIIMSSVSSAASLGNFLPCDGSSYPSSTYTNLYSVIGTIYGSISPGTFRVPNLQNRFPIGKGNIANLAGVGGSTTASLAANQLVSHTHTQTDGVAGVGHNHGASDHTHDYTAITSRAFQNASGASDWIGNMESTQATQLAYLNISTATTGISVNSNGSGNPFPIQNPFLTLNYAIAY